MATPCGLRTLSAMEGGERLFQLECSEPFGHDGPHVHRDRKSGKIMFYFFSEKKLPEPKPELKIDKFTRNFRPRKKEETLW